MDSALTFIGICVLALVAIAAILFAIFCLFCSASVIARDAATLFASPIKVHPEMPGLEFQGMLPPSPRYNDQ
jgi:hypothetical protein